MKKAIKTNVEEDYNKPFPKLLRELCEKHNITQNILAHELNLTRQTISSYLLGQSIPDMYTFEKIVSFFNKNYQLNYSMEYWLGKEKIFLSEKKEIIKLSNQSIENLKEYQKSDILLLTLEIILNQKAFIERLSDYIVKVNLGEIIEENASLNNFLNLYMHLNTIPKTYQKYKYYDLLEILPLLKEFSKEETLKYLASNKDILFEYCEYLVGEEFEGMKEIIDEYQEEMCSYDEDLIIEEQEKIINAYEKSKDGKQLICEYEKYRIKKEGENNEHKRKSKK